MRQLVFPGAGVPLRGAPDDEHASSLQGSGSAQVMQLELPKAILDELVKSARGGKAAADITIQFGRTPVSSIACTRSAACRALANSPVTDSKLWQQIPHHRDHFREIQTRI